jgi:hypothetical protein
LHPVNVAINKKPTKREKKKNYLKIFVLSLIATGLTFTYSCKKENKCPDAAYYANLKNNKPTLEEWLKDNPQFALKSAAENDCDNEQKAVEQGAADSSAYTVVVREKMHLGLTSPRDIQEMFWEDFNYEYVSKKTFPDTLERSMYVIELWREIGGGTLSQFRNPETMEAFYESCSTYFGKCDNMIILRKALYDCETYVGIDELELDWDDWNDECGGGEWVEKVNSPEKTAVTNEVIQRTQGR